MGILGTIGIADKGTYNQSVTYVTGNSVYYEGSTWTALKDNLTGIPPEEGENWKYLARGFGSDNLSQIEGKDTSGMLGIVGVDVVSQALIDAIADRVMTKLIPYTNIVNHFLSTDPKTVLSGPMGKSLKDQLEQLNSNLAAMKIPVLLGKITAVGSISINASLYREIALYIKTSAGGFLPPVIIHTNLLSASPLRVHPTMFYGVSNYLSTTVDISLTAINYVSSSASESSFASLDAWGIK